MKTKASDFKFFLGCPCYIASPSAIPFNIEGVDISTNSVIVNGIKCDPKDIKPILRRFESLSRDEVEELNKLWPHENIKRTTFESIQLDADIINFLTSLHVDVFGWIDQDLAVDAAYNSNTQQSK